MAINWKFWKRNKVPQVKRRNLGNDYFPPEPKFPKLNKFIKNGLHHLRLGTLFVLDHFKVKSKLLQILKWVINITGTGILIWFCIKYRNIFSYGLIAMLVPYYLRMFVQIVKEPYRDPEDEDENKN